MPNEINETLLTPEQFFEANSFASDYIRKEDFLKYCEQLEFKVQILNEIAKINEARTVLIIFDCLNEYVNRRGKERLPRSAFLEVAKNIYNTFKTI